MKNRRGVTLIEVIIAMVIMIIASLGFLIWETNMFRNTAAIERNNTAYAMAMDVADRLQRMSDNALIQPKNPSTNRRCVGYDNSGNLLGCMTGGSMDCNAGTPSGVLSVGLTGMTKFTNPWNGVLLYLYDGNKCRNTTWTDAACGSNVTIMAAANSNIDHPNSVGTVYNSVNPVRSYRGTTFYAVWSVAYQPCVNADSNKRKIFVTVYWIVPEPTDATAAAVQTKIGSGVYSIKSVSVAVDKTIGAES